MLTSIVLTGMPAVHGDEAVAALDNELVEPYLARPDNDCSLIDSDDTIEMCVIVANCRERENRKERG